MTRHLVFRFVLFFAALPLARAQTPAAANSNPTRPPDGVAVKKAPGKPGTSPANPAAAAKPPTKITCETEMDFDAKTHKAIFIGKVHVVDSEFDITSDKLTAFLKHEEKTAVKTAAVADPKAAPDGKPAATPKATPKSTPKPDAASKDAKGEPAQSGGGGLERALAEGNVVIIQDKVDPDTGEAKHYIGKALKADYDVKTGNIVLTGNEDPATWPQLQEGINNHIATESGVVMTMNREGSLHTKGKTKTVIVNQPDEKSKTPNKDL